MKPPIFTFEPTDCDTVLLLVCGQLVLRRTNGSANLRMARDTVQRLATLLAQRTEGGARQLTPELILVSSPRSGLRITGPRGSFQLLPPSKAWEHDIRAVRSMLSFLLADREHKEKDRLTLAAWPMEDTISARRLQVFLQGAWTLNACRHESTTVSLRFLGYTNTHSLAMTSAQASELGGLLLRMVEGGTRQRAQFNCLVPTKGDPYCGLYAIDQDSNAIDFSLQFPGERSQDLRSRLDRFIALANWLRRRSGRVRQT